MAGAWRLGSPRPRSAVSPLTICPPQDVPLSTDTWLGRPGLSAYWKTPRLVSPHTLLLPAPRPSARPAGDRHPAICPLPTLPYASTMHIHLLLTKSPDGHVPPM